MIDFPFWTYARASIWKIYCLSLGLYHNIFASLLSRSVFDLQIAGIGLKKFQWTCCSWIWNFFCLSRLIGHNSLGLVLFSHHTLWCPTIRSWLNRLSSTNHFFILIFRLFSLYIFSFYAICLIRPIVLFFSCAFSMPLGHELEHKAHLSYFCDRLSKDWISMLL